MSRPQAQTCKPHLDQLLFCMSDPGLETLVLGAALHGDVKWPEAGLFADRARRAALDAANPSAPDLLAIREAVPEHLRNAVAAVLIEAVDAHIGPWRMGHYVAVLEAYADLRRFLSAARDVAAALSVSFEDGAVIGARDHLRDALP